MVEAEKYKRESLSRREIGLERNCEVTQVPISSEFKLNQAIRARIYKAVQYFKEAP